MSRRRVIIESPYRGENVHDLDVDQNVKYARRAVKDSFDRDEAPLASHLLYTQAGILADAIPSERRAGMEAGHRWIVVADAVIFYLDRGMSDGMIVAEQIAKAAGITIEKRYLDNHSLDAE